MRTVTIAIALIAAIGCGDTSSEGGPGGSGGNAGAGGEGGSGGAGGEGGAEDAWELVICDEVEVVEREGSTFRYLKAVYRGVEEGTETLRFCDVWSLNNGNYSESVGERCTEGTSPFPGFYRDGDLHVVCSELDVYADGSSLEIGARQIYVRFDEEAIAGAGGEGGTGGTGGEDLGDPRGELVTCDRIVANSSDPDNWNHQKRLEIPLEPGEIVTVTNCDNYVWVDGVAQPPHFDWECKSFQLTFEEDGPLYDFFCAETIASDGTVTEYGFAETWIKREST